MTHLPLYGDWYYTVIAMTHVPLYGDWYRTVIAMTHHDRAFIGTTQATRHSQERLGRECEWLEWLQQCPLSATVYAGLGVSGSLHQKACSTSTVVTDPAAENHLVCSCKRRQYGVKRQRLQVLQNL